VAYNITNCGISEAADTGQCGQGILVHWFTGSLVHWWCFNILCFGLSHSIAMALPT
jgi:hypothetical protein